MGDRDIRDPAAVSPDRTSATLTDNHTSVEGRACRLAILTCIASVVAETSHFCRIPGTSKAGASPSRLLYSVEWHIDHLGEQLGLRDTPYFSLGRISGFLRTSREPSFLFEAYRDRRHICGNHNFSPRYFVHSRLLNSRRLCGFRRHTAHPLG